MSRSKRERTCAEVARLLRLAREAKGLSMTAVAQKAGLSQQMVSFVERGLRNPTLDSLLRIADAIEIDPADLLREAMRGNR